MNDNTSQPSATTQGSQFDRRKFLWSAAAGLAVVGAGATLVSCANGGQGGGQSAQGPAGEPKSGGTLRVGAQGGANTDTLDAQNGLTNTDYTRNAQLYDPLVKLDNTAQPQLVLAKEITPNKDATEWTIVIPPGVTTHQGKPFTADDVLYSLKRIVDNKFPGLYSLGPIDIANSKVVDPTTLKVAYAKPYAILVEGLTTVFMNMVPRDYDPKRPDGTGPFKFESFTPGVASKFVRNGNYWRGGLPHLDAVVTTNIADETSQVNALQSGQVDAINYLSQGSVAALQSGGMHVVVSDTGGWGPFTMRVDQKPFDDVRVRQALRLIVDRQEMLNQVFGGKGKIGNDVFGIFDKDFPKDLPQRHQDIDQAKSLLKAAGQENLVIELVTTPNAPGMIPAAQVFATQAKKAGVTVNIVQQTTTDYFANSYLKATFSQDYWPTQPYLVAAGQALAGPDAPFNACKFNDPEYNSLYGQAIAELDPGKRADLIHAMVKIDYDRGANIIPYFFPTVDAVTQKVGGVQQNATGFSPGGNDFVNFWLA